jgi:hypothetical protein
MGTKGMKRETRVEYMLPTAGWLRTAEDAEWFRGHGYETRTFERYVTEWTLVEEGKQ